jgi:NAD(P)-dependent dehydrogenase (short-subunit alcohol dehydrogenase family)
MSVPTKRTALVSGSPSGVGRATAEALVKEGVIVFGASRRATSKGPEVVAEVVLKAAQDRNPKLRSSAGRIAQKLNMQRRIVPTLLFDKVLRKRMTLHNSRLLSAGVVRHSRIIKEIFPW